MEEHVPVLFLDLNDDLSTPCDDDPVSAVRTGKLFAEKEDTMIELPIIKRDDTQVSPRVYVCVCVYTCHVHVCTLYPSCVCGHVLICMLCVCVHLFMFI